MALSTNLGSYADVAKVLDAALSAGGARYRVKDRGTAIHWRQRAYKFRSLLLRQKAKELELIPGLLPSTPYDALVVRIDPNDECVCVITERTPHGELTDLDGKPLVVGKPDEEGAELLAEAMSFAEGLE